MTGPMLGGGSGRGRSYTNHRPIGEINITPFVDVMLVLLVVFMITAPLITQGVQIALPEVDNTPINEEKEPIQVSIKQNGTVYIQAQKVAERDLVNKLKAIQKVRKNPSVMVNADKNVSYGKVMEVMSALQTAGLVDVGLITQPPNS